MIPPITIQPGERKNILKKINKKLPGEVHEIVTSWNSKDAAGFLVLDSEADTGHQDAEIPFSIESFDEAGYHSYKPWWWLSKADEHDPKYVLNFSPPPILHRVIFRKIEMIVENENETNPIQMTGGGILVYERAYIRYAGTGKKRQEAAAEEKVFDQLIEMLQNIRNGNANRGRR